MRGKVFTLASVALISCRAVLGIEDLDETTDGGKPSTGDSGTDAATKDAAKDAGSDAPANACVSEGANCGKCCRDKDMQSNKALQDLLAGCVCDGGCGATNDCNGTTACGGGTEPAGTGCIPCLDRVIKADSCKKPKDDCAQNAACKAVYDCIHGCP